MNQGILTAAGIAFLCVGAAFCAAGFYLNRPESRAKAAVSAAGGMIFYLLGAVTAVSGLLALVFRADITRKAAALFCLVYLVFLTALSLLFILLTGKKQ